MTQIGIVGHDSTAKVHAQRYAKMDGVELAAIVSPDSSTPAIDEYTDAVSPYEDASEMYAEESLDAIDICTSTDNKRYLIEPAIESGLDVLCESPIERTLTDAQALADVIADTDVTFFPGHILRFTPEYATARERVREGDIGTPGTVRTFRQTPFDRDHGRFADNERGSGVFLGLAIRDFDFLRWTFGKVERVFARRRQWDGHDYGLVTLRFANGAVGHVDARSTRHPHRSFVTRFDIAGKGGLLTFDSDDSSSVDIDTFDGKDSTAHDAFCKAYETDPYRRELAAFVECVRTGIEPPVTIDDSIEALRIALAAKESAQSGRPVAPLEVAV